MLLNRLWKATSGVLFGEHGLPGDPNNVRQRAQDVAPVVWLLGKTGAGKTHALSKELNLPGVADRYMSVRA